MIRLLAIILVFAQVATPTAEFMVLEDMATHPPQSAFRFCEFSISSNTIKKDTCFKFVEVPCAHDPIKTCAVLVKTEWEIRNVLPTPKVMDHD